MTASKKQTPPPTATPMTMPLDSAPEESETRLSGAALVVVTWMDVSVKVAVIDWETVTIPSPIPADEDDEAVEMADVDADEVRATKG